MQARTTSEMSQSTINVRSPTFPQSPQDLTIPPRNRPRPSTIRHRLHNKFLRRRCSKRSKPRHARPRRPRQRSAPSVCLPRYVEPSTPTRSLPLRKCATRDGYILTLVQPGGVPPPFPMNGPPPPMGMPRELSQHTRVPKKSYN